MTDHALKIIFDATEIICLDAISEGINTDEADFACLIGELLELRESDPEQFSSYVTEFRNRLPKEEVLGVNVDDLVKEFNA